MTEPGEYALALSDAEIGRYRLMADIARESEADLWQLAGIRSGAVVADVGCGPGALLPALAETVGSTGRIVAVDADPQAVAAATALAEGAGLANVSVRSGQARNTGVLPGSCDVVMMRHVLAHNGGNEQAIVDHLASLVRPGGCVFLVDIEASAMRIRPADPDFQDMFDKYLQFHTGKGNDLQVGLRLDELLDHAGLEVLEFRGRYNIVTMPPGMRGPVWAAREAMVAAGVATPEDVERWGRTIDRLQPLGPKMFATQFSAVGRRNA